MFETAYISTLYIAALLLAFVSSAIAAVGARRPIFIALAYLILIFYFPNASWGLTERDPSANFYTRATGTFFFSAINLFLFGLTMVVFLGKRFGSLKPASHNLSPFLWGFGLVFIGNIITGLALDIPWYVLLGPRGLLHLINLILAFHVLVACIRDEQELRLLINVFLFCAVTRALWGAFRFLVLGGDPANFYANYQDISVRLTFFDINDGFIATLAAFLVGWRLLHTEVRLGPWTRLGYLAILGLEVFIVVFSYRRTGWGGFALVALLFAFAQRAAVRSLLLVAYTGVGIPLLFVQALKRMGETTQGGSVLQQLLPDIYSGGQISFTSGRFAELYAAWLAIKESPLLGLGVWGEYRGSGFAELAFHHGNFGWMHSGILHIWLKSGFLGVALLLGMWWTHARFVARRVGDAPESHRGLLLVGVAGLLFYLPTWLVGTPVIEFRTMQLNALALALPYIAHAVIKKNASIAPR